MPEIDSEARKVEMSLHLADRGINHQALAHARLSTDYERLIGVTINASRNVILNRDQVFVDSEGKLSGTVGLQ